jgi:hypothetical protein
VPPSIPNRCCPLATAFALLSAVLVLNADPTGPTQNPTEPAPVEVDFLRDVRPILSGHCFKCHGPDEATRKARLRLDTPEGGLAPARSGYPAIVPHDTMESELVRRILAEEAQDVMPPPAAKLELSAAQKQILIRWIEQGAEYQPHWAFIKPAPPPLPNVRLATWPRNEIDAFVLARIEREGMAPSEPADPHTLVRRVHLDLIGLPPAPATSEAFVRDPSPEAYERLVDDLLASPHYGERWARRWLDLARYADTNGYEKDRPRSIWPWRDWVIDALNADMPFDQFTIEQIAGDLLPNPTLDQRIATGFHRNSMLNEEGGIDPLEYRFLAMVDRVHVTATTWLGLTMACAQCHTHKYDPIQQRDYYRFMALMNNADEPWIDVPQPDIAQQREEQLDQLAKLKAELPLLFPPDLHVDWLTPARSSFSSRAGALAERQTDGSWLVSGTDSEKDSYEITLDTSLERITHLQLEVLTHPDLPATGPGRGERGDFVLSEIALTAAPLERPGDTQAVQFAKATADFWQDDFQPRKSIDAKSGTGWAIQDSNEWHVPRTLTLALNEPVGFIGGTRLTVTLRQEHGSRRTLGRFRLGLGRELPDPRPLEVRRRDRLDREVARWLDREAPRAVDWFRLRPITASGSVPTLAIEDDDSVFASGDFTKRDVYSLELEGDWKGVRALRLEAIPDDRLPDGGPGRVAYEGPIGDFWLSDFKVLVGTNSHKLVNATQSYASGNDTAAKALDDDLQSGWSVKGAQGQRHNAVFQLDPPLDHEGTLRIEMTFERYYAAGLGRFRFWGTRDDNAVALPHPFDIQQRLLQLKQARTSDSRAAPSEDDLRLFQQYYASIAPELIDERDEIARRIRDLAKHPTTLVLQERPHGHTRPTFLHHRGEFLQPKDPVEPGVPSFLPDLAPDIPRNRLALAHWLVSPDNPLTPRVVMNRHWQAFFGRGLVRTTEDFGFQGELPTHPELLDWLALEFVRRDWSLKQMHKLIVTSATYQQSSHVTPDALENDPENVWLARGPRFRLDAEQVRDTALAVSGLLTSKIGGASVFPPQPENVTTEGAYGQLTWKVSEGPDRYRRSLYTFSKRTAPFAMYNTFDAPSGEACVARRDRSNTPLQSLTLLNDEMFLEAARALGRSAAGAADSHEARATRLFSRCVGRPPAREEIVDLLVFYEKQRARFDSGELSPTEMTGPNPGANPAEQAAWTAVARVLLNLDETITKS